jgi:hypothetical protein
LNKSDSNVKQAKSARKQSTVMEVLLPLKQLVAFFDLNPSIDTSRDRIPWAGHHLPLALLQHVEQIGPLQILSSSGTSSE